MAHKVGDVVYLDGHRMIVDEGPFRTLDQPTVNQYKMKAAYGVIKSAWESDLVSAEEFEEAQGCE